MSYKLLINNWDMNYRKEYCELSQLTAMNSTDGDERPDGVVGVRRPTSPVSFYHVAIDILSLIFHNLKIIKARKKSFWTIAYKTDIIKKWIKNREDIMKIWYIRKSFGN